MIALENIGLKEVENSLIVGTVLFFLHILDLSDDGVHRLLRDFTFRDRITHQGINHHLAVAASLCFLQLCECIFAHLLRIIEVRFFLTVSTKGEKSHNCKD